MTVRLYVALFVFVAVMVTIHRVVAPLIVEQGHGAVAITLISLLFLGSLLDRVR